MACHLPRFLRYLVRFSRTNYNFPSLPSVTLLTRSNFFSNQPSLREDCVLNQLSDLLPISGPPPQRDSHHSQFQTPCQVKQIDSYLLPEEKLRGVFLQKLKGKTAVENALTSVGVNLSVDVLSKVINNGNLGGEAMVVFFNWALKQPAIPKDVGTYNVVIKALGRRNFFDFMVQMLHRMSNVGVNPDLETLSLVIDSYVRARRVRKAIETFKNVRDEFGLCYDTECLNVVLKCLCHRGHVAAASSLLNFVRGKIPLSSVTYNVILGGWSRFGRVNDMQTNLRDMLKDGFSPDCLTFSYLIEGLGRAGHVDDAVEIFESMKDRDCMPDAAAYNAMISNYISVGKFDKCMELYQDMLGANCAPNVDTYTKLITAFVRVRKVADALEMFDEMLVRGIVPSTGVVTSFIKSLCSYGPPHAAMMIYKKSRTAGCSISISAYKLLLMRLSQFGKCGMLLKLWDEMQECGHTCDNEAYEYVILGLCNTGQLEKAVLVMEESLRKGFYPNRLVYSKLNNKLLASKQVERAYRLFLKIKDARRKANARRYWRATGWHF